MSKKLSKYISFIDYVDKSLIVLSASSGGVSIASFATAIGAPIGITSASLSLAFSLCTGLVKKLLKATRNKKRSIIKLKLKNFFKYKTMLSYCLKCKENTESVNPRVSATSNGRTILSKCAICGSKKSKFIKNQEAKGLLSSLGLKTPLRKMPLLGDVLF